MSTVRLRPLMNYIPMISMYFLARYYWQFLKKENDLFHKIWIFWAKFTLHYFNVYGDPWGFHAIKNV